MRRSALEISVASYLPKRGEDFYYATLGSELSASVRFQVRVVHAFWQWVTEMAEDAVLPEVVHQKLGWCRTELDRLYLAPEEVPSHPLYLALQSVIPVGQLRQSQWAACIEAAQMTLSTQIFETQASLNQHFQHLGGLRLSLIAQTLSGTSLSSTHENSLHHIGIGMEIVRHLSRLRHHLAQHHLFLPLDSFSSEEAAFAWMQSPCSTPEILQILQAQLTLAESCFAAVVGIPDLPCYRTIRREILLKQALLSKLERHLGTLLTRSIRLSPLRKLWIVL